MMRWLQVLVVTVVLGALIGCGATGPKFESFRAPPQDKALVYLYHASAALPFDVLIDRDKLGQLHDRSFLSFEVKPGYREILLQNPLIKPTRPLTMLFAAGTTYAVELDASKVGFLFGPFGLVQQIGERRLVPRSLEVAVPVLRNLNEVVQPSGDTAQPTGRTLEPRASPAEVQ
jgi:predicted small lipoprotein YifL